MAEKYVKLSDIEQYCDTYGACLVGKGQSATQAALRRVIEFAAENTADVQPVKRGKWIKATFDYSQCSICGEYRHQSNFCPNCGADMRGDDNG